jgi:hypothetical protein
VSKQKEEAKYREYEVDKIGIRVSEHIRQHIQHKYANVNEARHEANIQGDL